MKTAVIYWSGTGNTEAMARAVAEGMTAAGMEAVLLTPAEVQPGDLNLEVSQERLVTNVILDGAVLVKNLRHTGNNEKWLENRLHEMGISGTEKVFLATCDEENTLSVYLRVRDRKDMDIFT